MFDAMQKADILIEGMQWIRRFRGKVTVIKLGGSAMEDPRALAHLLLDIVYMETVGMRPVIVHGGGAAISRAMAEAGITARFVHGRRYTDDESLKIVEEVLADKVNQRLIDEIAVLGGKAKSLSFRTQNVLFGELLELKDEDGNPLDLGHVGHVTRVDAEPIRELCSQWIVPVIPSMCMTADGRKLNVNADTAAMAVAKAMNAEKFVFLSDVNGVRVDKDDPESLLHSITADDARQLIKDGIIVGGMIPKVQACLDVLDVGVKKVHIIDGVLRHSLLLEIFTSKGIGTEILPDLPKRGNGPIQ
jgi:acetylglutamate kinase